MLVEVIEIQDQFPDLVDDLYTRSNTREPADPFIIAYAKLNSGVVVVTNEKPKSLRSKNNRKTKIPDVCDFYDIPCCNLHKFVTLEELWP